MGMKLKWAMMITFLVLGILLWAVFWVAMWVLGISGMTAMYFTFGFVGIMVLFQWLIGPAIIKRVTKMKPCTDYKIIDMVKEISKKSKLKKAPKVYIVENKTPNAFAFGRRQGSAMIALHTGLLQTLEEDEIRGVIAHELGHIKHRDMTIMTLASVLPVILYYLVFFGTIYAGARDNRGGGFNYFGAMIGGMVAHFIGFLLVMYLSRVREYYADAHAAHTTQKPMALADALAKITYAHKAAKAEELRQRVQPRPTQITASINLRTFYISDPSSSAVNSEYLQYKEQMQKEKRRGVKEFFMTHPLTYKRINALEKLDKKGY